MNSDAAKTVLESASPDCASSREDSFASDVAVIITLTLLWLQLYYSLIPAWVHGQYYEFGWFVPPMAAFLFFRRWQLRSRDEHPPSRGLGLAVTAGILFPVLFSIRALEGFDSSWRLPMVLHAGMVALLSHWLILRHCGKGTSLGMIPVTVFALSAIPYPFQLENSLIQVLTEWVVQATAGLFHIGGQPVIVSGVILEFNGQQVEVADGCSGIRSLQSLIMMGLYFGELFRVRIGQRFLLVGLAGIVALIVNVGRALYLTHISFAKGDAAFEAAHDGVGHAAFGIGSICLLLITRVLVGMNNRRNMTLLRTKVNLS